MKANIYFSKALLAVMSVTMLASCEPFCLYNPAEEVVIASDRNQSMAFAGQWTGDFGMYYNYRYNGRVYRFDSYDTDIVFYPEYNGATYGWGKQVDFYQNGPYESIYNRFDWEIRGGVVYLTYYEDPSLDCDIYDYYMSNDRFTGRFGSSNATFSLTKIADYYNWNRYTGNYYSYSRTDWTFGSFRAPARNMAETGAAADSTSAGQDGIVAYGKR